MSMRTSIEPAIAATAERLTPGSGPTAVRQAKNDLSMLDATSDNLGARYAGAPVAIAAAGLFEAKQPDGDPVVFGKRREGVIIVYADSFVFVRNIGLGAREVKALGKNEVSVEKVTALVDGAEVPGLRIAARLGKPRFVLAITQAERPAQPHEATEVRDEIHDLLAG